jgi:hypothetical protein
MHFGGADGCVYTRARLYWADCSNEACVGMPHRHMHGTKRAAIAEWNRLNETGKEPADAIRPTHENYYTNMIPQRRTQ